MKMEQITVVAIRGDLRVVGRWTQGSSAIATDSNYATGFAEHVKREVMKTIAAEVKAARLAEAVPMEEEVRNKEEILEAMKVAMTQEILDQRAAAASVRAQMAADRAEKFRKATKR